MAYSFRAVATNGGASATSFTVTKPTGTVDGDLIVVAAYEEPETTSWSSPGSGFTIADDFTNPGSFRLTTWWKIASSEPASWTWTPSASTFAQFIICSYSGGSGSGNFLDGTPTDAQADAVAAADQTAPSITTTVDNDLVCYSYGNWAGVNVTATTGFCTNFRGCIGGLTISDANQATAGATGTSWPSAGPGTEYYCAGHAAFFLSLAAATNLPPGLGPVVGMSQVITAAQQSGW